MWLKWCICTRCKTCPYISNTVEISGPNRSVKVTDHFTCISTNVIYNCITCTLCRKIYIGETGRRLADRFLEHLRDVEKTTEKRPNQSRAILIFPITPTTTWLFAGYPYTSETKKMIFLTVVACEIGRNRYFAGTDQRTGSGVWWELWVI